MSAIKRLFQFMPRIAATSNGQAARTRPRFRALQAALLIGLSVAANTAPAQTANCVIASNDGRNGFRTDQISNCRINTSNGQATYVIDQERRSRSYVSTQPLTTQHLEAARYWESRSGQLRFPAATNPARFDPAAFLQAASQATHGFVLVRSKRSGGQALNVVYITDGVYRSIDFPGTSLRDMPDGLLTTAR